MAQGWRTRAVSARPRTVVAAVALAAAVAMCGVFGWWWAHPRVFGPVGNGIGATDPVRHIRTFHVPMTDVSVDSPTYQVRVRSVRPRVLTNTAEARIAFSVCRVSNGGFIAVTDRLSRHCSDIRPVEGTTMTVNGDNDEYLVMTVRPTRAGVVRIRGIDLAYSLDWRHVWRRGTQATGMEVRIRVR